MRLDGRGEAMKHLRFQFDEQKAVEVLAYMAGRWPGITQFYAAKVLFFAEKKHLNRYCRPIVADTFIAMPNGPVPGTLYDFIKGNLDQAGDPQAILDAIEVDQGRYKQVRAKRPADLSFLSDSDVECLEEAIRFCHGKKFDELSQITHRERAWQEAPQNGPMDYEALIDEDNPNRDAVLEQAREFAAYGVL